MRGQVWLEVYWFGQVCAIWYASMLALVHVHLTHRGRLPYAIARIELKAGTPVTRPNCPLVVDVRPLLED